MSNQSNPLHTPSKGKQLATRSTHGVWVSVKHLAGVCGLVLCLALFQHALPSRAEAAPLPPRQAVLELVDLDSAGPGAIRTGSINLAEQPGSNWLTRLVEFFTPVSPKCGAMPQQQAHQKCEQRERGVLENFKRDHPVAFNLLVSALTLLVGFYIGGGFGGGK